MAEVIGSTEQRIYGMVAQSGEAIWLENLSLTLKFR